MLPPLKIVIHIHSITAGFYPEELAKEKQQSKNDTKTSLVYIFTYLSGKCMKMTARVEQLRRGDLRRHESLIVWRSQEDLPALINIVFYIVYLSCGVVSNIYLYCL